MRTIYVGLSGPIGYNYAEHGAHMPNAVLEDVTGLLLCYDQIVFLSRDLCPADMRGLEYVRFVEDDSQQLARAQVAIEQFLDIEERAELGKFHWQGWQHAVQRVTAGDPDCRVDNHSRPLRALPNDFRVAGNAADVGNALLDVGVAASLELPQVDILTNSAASRAVNQAIAELDPAPRQIYTDWHVDVAQELGAIRVPNAWNGVGAYDPSIEALRHHDQIEAFRAFLAKGDCDGTEAAARAAEVTRLAHIYSRKVLRERYASKSIYKSVGRALLGPALNAVQPGLGTAASAGVKVFDWASVRQEKADSAWAMFVVDLAPDDAVGGQVPRHEARH